MAEYDGPERRRRGAGGVRVPLHLEVELVVKDLDQFVSEYSGNLSKHGMFLRTRRLLPVGTKMDFALRLDDRSPLIRGRGVVVWTRSEEDGSTRPPGMGVRFESLDEPSRRTIDEMVWNYILSGGTPFELDSEEPAQEERRVWRQEDLLGMEPHELYRTHRFDSGELLPVGSGDTGDDEER